MAQDYRFLFACENEQLMKESTLWGYRVVWHGINGSSGISKPESYHSYQHIEKYLHRR